MKKTFNKKIVCVFVLAAVCALSFFGCAYNNTEEQSLKNIKFIDLSVKPANLDASLSYLYDFSIVENGDLANSYFAHPDSVLLDDGKILTMYVNGHGKGPLVARTSSDGGKNYSTPLATPQSFATSEETPTLYQLDFLNGSKKIILISANPKWSGYKSGDGFNVSISNDNGQTFSEFQKFYGKDSGNLFSPIVAMSALVRLKEDGQFVDKWLGFFHDNDFKCYSTVLSFDANGQMSWSVPREYLSGSNKLVAKKANLCEVEIIRSDKGEGNQLLLIGRCNNKSSRLNATSFIALSDDEGETWSDLKYSPDVLHGERHKAEYASDGSGRLLITFRSIILDKSNAYNIFYNYDGFSYGAVAWVGTYDDIVNWYNGDKSSIGSYYIKLAHTYFNKTKDVTPYANDDTGYCGNVALADGSFAITSYGRFLTSAVDADGNYRSVIISKQINLADIDRLAKFLG